MTVWEYAVIQGGGQRTFGEFKRPKIARHFTEEELKYRTHSAVHEAKTKGDVDKAYLRMTSYSTSSVDYGYWWIELPGKTEDIIDEYEEIRDELVSCIYGVWDHLKTVVTMEPRTMIWNGSVCCPVSERAGVW